MKFIPAFDQYTMVGLLLTLVIIFSFKVKLSPHASVDDSFDCYTVDYPNVLNLRHPFTSHLFGKVALQY